MAAVGKVWKINLNGKGIRVEDIPLRLIDPIATAHEVTWFEVVNTPLVGTGGIVLALVDVAAAYLEVEAPVDLTARQVVDLFTLVDDTVPEPDPVEPDFLDQSGPQTETAGSPQ